MPYKVFILYFGEGAFFFNIILTCCFYLIDFLIENEVVYFCLPKTTKSKHIRMKNGGTRWAVRNQSGFIFKTKVVVINDPCCMIKQQIALNNIAFLWYTFIRAYRLHIYFTHVFNNCWASTLCQALFWRSWLYEWTHKPNPYPLACTSQWQSIDSDVFKSKRMM